MLSGRLGPYTLLRQIAVGGMAEIYLAVTSGTAAEAQHRVAIKVIHQQHARDPDFIRMLLDEARLTVQLKHPNIVTTHDLCKEGNQYYLVMELVDGADLFKLQQRAADQHLSFPVELAAVIAREVARGLHYAHALCDGEGRPLNVVHRDISPQNVLISLTGEVKITDFGIAKAEHNTEKTQAGIIKGKYYYMSPEQAMGQTLDGRTDLFAAAILLYEMLLGEMLYFEQDVDRLLQRVREANIPPVSKRRPDTPAALEQILMKALRKRADDRYPSAAAFADALDGFIKSYAPGCGAADVGRFVERALGRGSRMKPRTASEPTASFNVELEQSPDWDESDASPSPTAGLSDAHLGRLGFAPSPVPASPGPVVDDENSLIFKSASRLMKLMGESSRDDDNGPATVIGRSAESGVLEPKPESRREPGWAQARRARGVRDKREELDVKTQHRRVTPPERRRRPETTPGPAPLDEPIHNQPFSANSLNDPTETVDVVSQPFVPRIDEVKVELTQSDDDFGNVQAIVAPEARASAQSLDPISAETTHEALEPPPLRTPLPFDPSMSAPMPSGSMSRPGWAVVPMASGAHPALASASAQALAPVRGRSSSFPAVPVGPISQPPVAAAASGHALKPVRLDRALPPEGAGMTPRRRALLVVCGMLAGLLSAALTWQLASPNSVWNRRGRDGAVDMLAAAPDLRPLLQLLLYDAPAEEPPPAPLQGTEPAAGATPEKPDKPGRGAPSESGSGEILLTSVPPGAEVFMHKKSRGVTPLLLQGLPTGEDAKVELRLEGFKNTRKKIKWQGGTHLEVSVPMKTAPAAEEDAGAAPK